MSISRKNNEQYLDPIAYAALTAVVRLKMRSKGKFMPLVYDYVKQRGYKMCFFNKDMEEVVADESD